MQQIGYGVNVLYVKWVLDSGVCTARQRRQWQPTPVLLPGKSHGRRSLVGYSPWSREESDTTEQLHFSLSLYTGWGFPGGSDGKESAFMETWVLSLG